MNTRVKKRETFYLAGYDPRGARYYHDLYKNESLLQSQVNGMDISVGKRKRSEIYVQTWSVDSNTKGLHTETQYHFLEWDDIIREDWKKNFLELFFDLLFYFKTYILAGRFSQYMIISPYQMVGIFLPSVYTFFALLLAIFLGYQTYLYFDSSLGVVIGLGLFYLIMYVLITAARKIAIFWLVRIFVFSARYALHEQKVLESRLDIFATYIEKHIKTAKENNVDELLLVCHSVGTILMIPLLEKILKNLNKSSDIQLSVLVLGECIPLVTCINKATEYKLKMEYIAKSKHINLVDYTTVIDGACFPTLNYFEDAHIEISQKDKFHFLSARFHTLFSKKRYKELRKNKYLTHFIYFMATEIEGDYDFFKMTAGHTRLNHKQGTIDG